MTGWVDGKPSRSNNDRLWSEMVALGWMNAADPLDAPVRSKVYVVKPVRP
ncbi:MAG TPA: hypothetical protein VNZ53_42995 [Steroidobacteraceae bacterium]|jgi:hypothetical protein|nr:hypothetical protein [Steroidobacteraceae bacterium]